MYNRLLQISPPVILRQQWSCYSFLWGCLKIILLLKSYSPLWTLASIYSSTISSGLWPLPACFSFPLYLRLLLCYLSIFCMIIIFFLFLPFWHKIYFWKQNNGYDNSVKISKILILPVCVKSIPCSEENNMCFTTKCSCNLKIPSSYLSLMYRPWSPRCPGSISGSFE